MLLLPRIGTELVPEDDQSEFNVSVNLPRGTTLDRTAEYVKDIEPMLLATDNVQTVFTNIQPNQGNYLVGLAPIEERDVSQQDMIREVRSKLQSKYPGHAHQCFRRHRAFGRIDSKRRQQLGRRWRQ